MSHPTGSTLNPDEQPDSQMLMDMWPYAGFWRRAAAMWADTLLNSLLALIPSIILMAATYMLTRQWPAMHSNELTVTDWLNLVISIVIYFAYFAWFDLNAEGKTPGRQIVGIALHSCDGHNISLAQSLIRQLGKWASVLVLGIGYKIQPFNRRKQTWHDMWSRTVVVVIDQTRPVWLIWLLNTLGILVTLAYLVLVAVQMASQMSFAP